MSYYGPQFNAYGAMPQIQGGMHKPKKTSFVPNVRSRMRAGTVLTSLFAPWILFIAIYSNMNFLMYYSSGLSWTIDGIGEVISIIMFSYAMSKRSELWTGNPFPAWIIFLALSCFAATTGGSVVGYLNYSKNLRPYYDLQNLNSYNNVDPQTAKGRQMMDAGRVYFLQNATVDVWKAYSFRNDDLYCVAPVSIKNAKTGAPISLEYYDFWVVGLNCCDGNYTSPVNYRCGPLKNSSAHDGLRLMSNRQRDFYKLAVQQAEANFRITAKYPILFYWSTDADSDMTSYWNYGMYYYGMGILLAFLVQGLAFIVGSFVITHVFNY